jgi:formate C-acetyltransferase
VNIKFFYDILLTRQNDSSRYIQRFLSNVILRFSHINYSTIVLKNNGLRPSRLYPPPEGGGIMRDFSKVLEMTLNNVVDPQNGKHIGLETGDPLEFNSFSELYAAFEQQVKHFIQIKVGGNQVIERLYARLLPCPFLSIVVDDCIQKGKEYHDGGARYNTTYIHGVGIGTITDSLAAIQYHVFEHKNFSLSALLEALRSDSHAQERMRQVLVNKTPKYGNGDDFADSVMNKVFDTFFDAVEGRKNTKGGEYHIDMLPTTCQIYFSSVLGTSVDGRRAGNPVSEGISPVQGADRCGPTAVIKSAARMDHVRTGGTLLNQKFTPHLLNGEEGQERLVYLVRAYFKWDGHHIQFNVVDSATLRFAQKDPEKYRDLIVRVAGYSDYFCDLSPVLQEEIIMRTERQQF